MVDDCWTGKISWILLKVWVIEMYQTFVPFGKRAKYWLSSIPSWNNLNGWQCQTGKWWAEGLSGKWGCCGGGRGRGDTEKAAAALLAHTLYIRTLLQLPAPNTFSFTHFLSFATYRDCPTLCLFSMYVSQTLRLLQERIIVLFKPHWPLVHWNTCSIEQYIV